MAFGIDPSQLAKLQSFADYQQAEEEFQFKKQLLQQNAMKNQLETQVLQQQMANGGITPEKLLGFQIQMQNHQDALANQKATREETNAYRKATLDLQRDKIENKQDLKFKNDQNLLNNSATSLQDQIDRVDRIFGKRDANGALLMGPNGQPIQAPIAGLEDNYGWGQISNRIGGTKASDAQAALDQLNANSFIQALGQMKSQSATGASGLGALSEKEGDKVQSASSAAANRKQSFDSAVKNALLYRQELVNSQNRLQAGFQNIYGNQAAPNAPTMPQIDPEAARAELARRAAARK